MAGGFTAIDMSQLPAPNVVLPVSYEVTLAAMLAELRARDPVFDALVESDPAYKLLEVAAYYKTLTDQRVNDAARAVMPAYAAGSDLDQIAARFGVQRSMIDQGDPDARPPVPAVLERDEDFRRRMLLAFEGLSTAGPAGAYIFHALSADPDVADASVESLSPGEVLVSILSRSGDGTAPSELLAIISGVLEEVRPLTDLVTVQSATVVFYSITASLTVLPGPDSAVVRQTAENAVSAYAVAKNRLGHDVTLSGLFAALHQSGVQNVTLTNPAADVVISDSEVAHCTVIMVTVGGADV
ncbi:MAG: baseplate assembly protein [Rhodobacteraceae bacterium]|nr:MAG: baseplate assembly protein [Paracoccaceae bacterium]